ncbi:MAG: hypothetical protein WBX01_13805 [Nitrososphaeraceae archaeon]
MTTEQVLHIKRKEEVVEAYNRFVKKIEAKKMSPDRKELLISPGRDIISLISEAA